jgi:hypothetical protein
MGGWEENHDQISKRPGLSCLDSDSVSPDAPKLISEFDVIIIGAGAAGLMCAIEAGKRNRKVLIIDHAKAVAEKIRISGGGRCNFTNLYASPDSFISNNQKFCVSSLRRFTQHDFIALVHKHGIAYHEKTLGQLFCDGSSSAIINMLLAECASTGVEIQLQTSVLNINRNDSGFLVETKSSTIKCKSVVVATGGPSIPKMGASGWGYDMAEKFGLKIIPPRPGLVPFTLGPEQLAKYKDLSGLAVDVVATCNKKQFAEGMLFTHRGLSGPAILQISSYWRSGDTVTINLAPQHDLNVLLKTKKQSQPKQELQTLLAQILPKRLALSIAEEMGFKGNMADLSNKKIEQVASRVNRWQVIPVGTEGYRVAEVTIGGVDVDELSSQTFESKKVRGLYFIGEVVDVTGHLGGFNFQWAWSSGWAAGQVV